MKLSTSNYYMLVFFCAAIYGSQSQQSNTGSKCDETHSTNGANSSPQQQCEMRRNFARCKLKEAFSHRPSGQQTFQFTVNFQREFSEDSSCELSFQSFVDQLWPITKNEIPELEKIQKYSDECMREIQNPNTDSKCEQFKVIARCTIQKMFDNGFKRPTDNDIQEYENQIFDNSQGTCTVDLNRPIEQIWGSNSFALLLPVSLWDMVFVVFCLRFALI